MSKCSLILKHYDDYGNIVNIQDIYLENNNFESIADIDKYTSSRKIYDFWQEIFLYNDCGNFSSVFIKNVDDDKTNYYNVILNNKVINNCVNDLEGNNINKNNIFFKKEYREFINYLCCYDLKYFRENLDIDDDSFMLIYDFKYNRTLESYDALLSLFSNYLFFRDWVSNKNKIKKEGINFNKRTEENSYDYKFKNYNHKFDSNFSFYDDDFFDINFIKRKIKSKQL